MSALFNLPFLFLLFTLLSFVLPSAPMPFSNDPIDILVKGMSNSGSNHPHPKGKYTEFIERLKTGDFKKIIFLIGAGVSTSSGIPDFRSETGLFNQLQNKYSMSREFFNIETFYRRPKLFYDFSKNLQIEKYKPSIFHYFMGFINSKKNLKYVFTQNIDALERKSGIEEDKIIFAHGNLYEAHCPKCKTDVEFSKYKEHYEKGEILYCEKCGTPIKSKVVFYGEGLSDRFFDKSIEVFDGDLVFIAGTSLEVPPFNKLAYSYVNPDAYRIVINELQVGKTMAMGIRGFRYYEDNSNDLFLKGSCDTIAMKIVEECGWKEEFEEYVKKMKKINGDV